MAQLSLDPQSLQALREMTDAVRASTSAQKQTGQQQAAVQQQLIGLHSNLNHLGAHQSTQNILWEKNRANAPAEAWRNNSWFGRAIHGTPEFDDNGKYYGKVGGLLGRGGPFGASRPSSSMGAPTGASASGLGAIGRIAGPLIALEGLQRLAGGVSTIVADAQNQYSTPNQDTRRIIRMLPGGETGLGMFDAFSGRESKMTEAQKAGNITRDQGLLGLHGLQQSMDIGTTYRGLSARAEAYASTGPVLPPLVDRSTAHGEQRFKDLSRLVPLQVESARAEREARAATAERASAEMNAIKIAATRNDLENKIAEQRKVRDANKGTFKDSGKHEQATRLIDAYQAQLNNIRPMHEQAARTVADKRVAESKASAGLQIAKVREEREGQAAILDDRAARAKSTAVRFGSMHFGERAEALAAYKIAKQAGNLDVLPPELKARLASALPEEYEAMAAKSGAAAREYQELQRLKAVDTPGAGHRILGVDLPNKTPSQLQEQADGLRRKSAEERYKIEENTAQLEADTARKLAEAVTATINRAMLQVPIMIDDKMRLGKN